MRSEVNLRRLGLENSGPLRAGHPECGLPCLLCKNPIQAGDAVGHIPQNPEDERSATLVAHWRCIEDGFNRLRGSRSLAPGATRRYLESWAGVLEGDDASTHPYASEADFILKHGRAFEWRALPHGVRMGVPRQCFRNAVRLALRKPRFYTYVEGYAINTWVAEHPVAHAWCVDPEHFVVDTTWEEGSDYFGVPFRAEYVRRMAGARRMDYPLIDNEEMGFPLLTGAHAVAEAVIA
jgi:hypothetical protein